MNGTQLAVKLATSTRVVGRLLRSGKIKAKRKRQAWVCDPDSVEEFIRKNEELVNILRAEYLSLFWGGLSVEYLQAQVKGDFQKRGILWPVKGFVEYAVREDLQRERAKVKELKHA